MVNDPKTTLGIQTMAARKAPPRKPGLKLNLGCGQNRLKGYVNVDKHAGLRPDVVHDLESFPWPFEDGAADEIVMFHVLEHMGADAATFLAIIKELYRVLAPGGRLVIVVPHPRSDDFINDPTHVRAVTPQVLSLFSKENCRKWARDGASNSPLALAVDVDFEIESAAYRLTPRWQARARGMTKDQLDEAIATHNNVVREIEVVLRAVGR